MRLFLYGLASFCGFIALALLLLPILSSLENLDNGIGVLLSVEYTAQVRCHRQARVRDS